MVIYLEIKSESYLIPYH